MTEAAALPDELSALKALVEAQRVEIARLQLLIAKRRRHPFGRRSEQMAGLLDQLELQLEELETGDAEVTTALDPASPPNPSTPPRSPAPRHPTFMSRTRRRVRTAAAR